MGKASSSDALAAPIGPMAHSSSSFMACNETKAGSYDSHVAPPSSRIKGLGDLPPTPAAGSVSERAFKLTLLFCLLVGGGASGWLCSLSAHEVGQVEDATLVGNVTQQPADMSRAARAGNTRPPTDRSIDRPAADVTLPVIVLNVSDLLAN